MDGVREALERRGINGNGRDLVGDRMEWREVVYGRGGGGGLQGDLWVRHHPAN